jgi:hypothetical protein
LIRELGGDPDSADDAYLAAFYDGDTREQKPHGFNAKYVQGQTF